MNKILAIFLILMTVTSCATSSKAKKNNIEEILDRAEASASLGGRRVLEASRAMVANQEIVVGGCWDYINTVYDRAGYPSNLRLTVFKSKLHGPYVKSDRVEPGDWLYFVNHSYSNTEHSAIFVAWIDEEKKTALMVSYAGENQKKPAAYKNYVLTNIYNIIRAHD